MATARDVIKGALRKLGVLAAGETPSAAELSDGLSSLNDMLDTWSAQNLMIHQNVREEFTLTAGQQLRTLGPTGNFVTTRPTFVDSATIEDQSSSDSIERPLTKITTQQWAAIQNKSATTDLPSALYIEDTYPNLNLYFWGVPSVANKVVLYSQKPFTAFSSATSDISFPPGYKEAIENNLAKRLAPEYGRTLSPEIQELALNSLMFVKRLNSKPQLLGCDVGTLDRFSGFDIKTGV